MTIAFFNKLLERREKGRTAGHVRGSLLVHDLIEIPFCFCLIGGKVTAKAMGGLVDLGEQDGYGRCLGVPVEYAVLACELVLFVELFCVLVMRCRVGGYGKEEGSEGYLIAIRRRRVALGDGGNGVLIGALASSGVDSKGVELFGMGEECLCVSGILQRRGTCE